MITIHMILILALVGILAAVGWKLALLSLKGFAVLACAAYVADWLIKHNLLHL
jgi:hypothetical protein